MKILSLCLSLLLFLVGSMNAWSQAAALRPGDKVDIRLGGVPSEEIMAVTAIYTIDAEGFINLPHIGKVRAAGLQQHELQATIENRYKSDGIYTRPTITINQQTGDRFVNVDGEVRSRQRVPFTPDMTLMSAINAAGGTSEFADQKRVQLSRGGESQIIDIRRVRRDPNLDIKVQPGDHIFVPRSFW
jgi:protein involved in polysaccharide export with SLBB domain